MERERANQHARSRHLSAIALAATVAIAMSACKGGPPVAVRATKPPTTSQIISDHGGAIIGDAGASLISNNGGSLTGKVKIPAGIISNNSGSLISDQGGAIIGDAGASLVSNNGGGLTSKVKRQLLAEGDKPAAKFKVTLVDAGGTPFKDAQGNSFTAVTDATGGYSFPRTPRGANLVLRVDLPAAVGPMLAFVPDAAPDVKRSADVDGPSTLVMGYVLEAYVRTQGKPREVLAKLPAKVEAETRAKAEAALGASWPAPNFTDAGVRRGVGTLRAKDAAFDQQMDYVKSLLVVGQKDLGEGQAATAVAISWPTATLRLQDGSLLISERDSDRIRRRWPDGHLTTFAGKDGARALGDGGPADAAYIDRPNGLAADAEGNVFVADFGHHRIRRIDAKTHVISTVVGNGGDPAGIEGNNPFDGLDALAATLNHPTAVAVDGQGRVVFVANNGLYRLEADGKLKGLQPDVKSNPDSLATGPDGTVYGYQHDAGEVSVLTDATFKAKDGVPAQTSSDPGEIAVAPDGTIYVVYRTHVYKLAGGQWTELKLGVPFHNLKGASADADGVVACDFDGNKVFHITASGARQIAGIVPKSGDEPVAPETIGLNRPTSLAFDAAGNLFVADGLNNVVWKRQPDGLYVRFAGLQDVIPDIPTDAPTVANKTAIGGLVGVAAGPAGHTFLIEGSKTSGLYLRDVDPSGMMKVVKLPAGVLVPTALAAGPDGSLLTTDALLGQVFRIKGNEAEALAPDAGVAQPLGLAAGPGGVVYVTSLKDNSVVKLEKGTATVIAGNNGEGFSGDGGPATAAKLAYPFGLAVDAAGRVYVADGRNDRVRRIDPATGLITTVCGQGGLALTGTTPDESLREPIGLAFDAEENLYITDSGHNQVKLVKRAALGP
jgi:sugar lactone lactonase YvrE